MSSSASGCECDASQQASGYLSVLQSGGSFSQNFWLHSQMMSIDTKDIDNIEKIQKLEADGIVIENGKVGEEFII